MSQLRELWVLLIWQASRMRRFLPLAIVVQTLFAAGIVAGYPLLFPSLDAKTILFLATGAPAITLITIGLVAVPQLVAQARTEGSLDYLRSMPVPRLLFLVADLAIWLAIVLPGVVFAVVVASVRFDLRLEISPLVVPAMLLVVLTATSIGYAIASVLPQAAANMLAQVLVVFVLMFSPLNFPPERLPGWLAAVHSVLPVQAMGEVIRGTLAGNAFPLPVGAFVLLGAWCVGSVGVAWAVLARRA